MEQIIKKVGFHDEYSNPKEIIKVSKELFYK